MICPQCRSEYVAGITVCRECGVPLVEVLAPEEFDYIDYEEILATMNPGDVALIKSILDGAGIAYMIPEENFTLVSPWVQPARILVRKDLARTARLLLRDLDLSYSGTAGADES